MTVERGLDGHQPATGLVSTAAAAVLIVALQPAAHLKINRQNFGS